MVLSFISKNDFYLTILDPFFLNALSPELDRHGNRNQALNNLATGADNKISSPNVIRMHLHMI